MRAWGSTTKQTDDSYRHLLTDEQGNLCTRPSTIGLPVQRYLSLNGLGTGTFVANSNYAATSTDFYFQTNSIFDIYSFSICIADSGPLAYNGYGNIATGTVVNGLGVFANVGGIEFPLLSGRAITSNYQWSEIADSVLITTFSSNNQNITIYFDLINNYGTPFRLNANDKFIVRLHDNFTGLLSQVFTIKGLKT